MNPGSEKPASPDVRRLERRRRHRRTSAFAGSLFLVTPLIVFLRYQSYSLLEPEALASLGILALVGAVTGMTSELFGSWGRALMYALLITLTVDIQFNQPERLRLLGLVFLVGLAITFLLRHRLPRWGVLILVVNLLISLVAPGDHGHLGLMTGLDSKPGNTDLPVVVHLILDGHIGVEGIPPEIDKDGSEARRIRDLYLRHGFRVFGRAYSRYYRTHNSIPAVLNFDATRTVQEYVKSNGPDWILETNRYFAEMTERGYAIRVFQSTYMDYCSDDDLGNIESCWTFDPERLNVIQGTILSWRHKVRTILGMYSRLSSIATSIDIPTAEVTPIATLPVLQQLGDEIARAQPGTLFFAHLLLPHSPYGLTADCEVRPELGSWLMSHDKTLLPRRNTPATRFLRYPLYLAQLQCVSQRIDQFLLDLEQSPYADNMIIVIHGDHGSRLDCGPPEMKYYNELVDSDYVDAFSSLFAIKHRGVRPGYDRRTIALETLFREAMQNGKIPEGMQWAGQPQVLLEQGRVLRPQPLPVFERNLGETANPAP